MGRGGSQKLSSLNEEVKTAIFYKRYFYLLGCKKVRRVIFSAKEVGRGRNVGSVGSIGSAMTNKSTRQRQLSRRDSSRNIFDFGAKKTPRGNRRLQEAVRIEEKEGKTNAPNF